MKMRKLSMEKRQPSNRCLSTYRWSTVVKLERPNVGVNFAYQPLLLPVSPPCLLPFTLPSIQAWCFGSFVAFSALMLLIRCREESVSIAMRCCHSFGLDWDADIIYGPVDATAIPKPYVLSFTNSLTVILDIICFIFLNDHYMTITTVS